jgi:hypothetical protein
MSREAPGDLARDASVVQVLDGASPRVVDQQSFVTKVLFWSRLSRQFGPVVPRQSREIQKATHRIVCLKFFNRGLLPVRCFIAPITEQFKAGSESTCERRVRRIKNQPHHISTPVVLTVFPQHQLNVIGLCGCNRQKRRLCCGPAHRAASEIVHRVITARRLGSAL